MQRQMAGAAVVLASMQLALIACGGKSPTAPIISAAAAPFVGTWQNFGAEPQMDRIDISIPYGNLVIHEWGHCHPVNCDVGERSFDQAKITNGVLPIQWNSGFKVMTQALRIDASGQLELSVHNHFIDDSGRADYDFLEMLTKVK